jgi:hypothetical protein
MSDFTSIPGTIQIPLTRGYVAIVDECDADLLEFKWCLSGDGKYAKRNLSRNSLGPRDIYLHREILSRVLGKPPLSSELCDHINGDGLDNRRENLRVATMSQNLRNRGKPSTNKSGYKGVYWHKATGKWAALIRLQNKSYHLGLYENVLDAAYTYNVAAECIFGEFAVLSNMPEDWEVSRTIGLQARDMAAQLGIDLASGKPLLQEGRK